MWRSSILRFGVLLVVGVAGCVKSSTSPSPASLNLSGNWSGTLTRPGRTAAVTWNATQNGLNLTGPVVVTPQGAPSSITGTMSGTISGTQVTLTLSAPAGAFTALGSSTCSLTATSTATASANSMSGSMAEVFAAPCLGPITDTATQTEQLSLTKP